MDISVGLRVVRGPDWSWGDQDGGEGYVGTVIAVENPGTTEKGAAMVQWDCGLGCWYRCGAEGKFDLSVLDTSPTGSIFHHLNCRACKKEGGIAGMVWKCRQCLDYQLCTHCYFIGKHSPLHDFLRIDDPDDHEMSSRVLVGARRRSVRIQVRGIFPGAEVVRGLNWKWNNQDGGVGNTGKVISILGWKNETQRSVVEVQWNGSTTTNIYRLGHRGKVDLQYVPDGSSCWGYYCQSHLPVLGSPHTSSEQLLVAGDKVKVQLDPEIWKLMQSDHGGWNDRMAAFIGDIAIIQCIEDNGGLVLSYGSGSTLLNVHPDAPTKVDSHCFNAGDVVRVLDDLTEVSKYQKGHGEWVEEMASSLGQLGTVLKILPQGDLTVSVNGRRWIYNPMCLRPAPWEIPSDQAIFHINSSTRARMNFLLDSLDPETIAQAALVGDSTTISEFLEKHPEHVDYKVDGKTGLHFAVEEGFTHVIIALLKYSANTNIADKIGDTPLHYCARHNHKEAARLLVDAGADLNYKNALGMSPIFVAVISGANHILQFFAHCHGVDLSGQASTGSTPLHLAVQRHRIQALSILVGAGADITAYNSSHFSPAMEAAKKGFYSGIEEMMSRYPEHVNIVKLDDGHTTLHIAVANNRLDTVCLLASLKTCDLDAKNFTNSHTPLHLSVQRGFSRQVEHLVAYGANLNAIDILGNTPLHIVTLQKHMKAPTQDSPELLKIKEELEVLCGGNPLSDYVVVACFMLREGAKKDIVNLMGLTALQSCPSDVQSLITQFLKEHKGRRICGSLKRFPYPNPTMEAEDITLVSSRNALSQTLPVDLTITDKNTNVDNTDKGAPCIMCDKMVDVQLNPCGHSSLCSQCVQKAKRCAVCKEPIKSKLKLTAQQAATLM